MITKETIQCYSMGPSPIELLKWGLSGIEIPPTATVLDLGCGFGLSSAQLANTYRCRVIALEKWTKIDKVHAVLQSLGASDEIVPVQGDARDIPFPKRFFSHIVAIYSYIYFGTDDTYAPYVWQFLQPGGLLCFTVPGFVKDVPGQGVLPSHLRPFFADECWTWHTAEWWHDHISRTGRFQVLAAECMANSYELWRKHYVNQAEYARSQGRSTVDAENDLAVVEADQGKYMGFIKVVAEAVAVEQVAGADSLTRAPLSFDVPRERDHG